MNVPRKMLWNGFLNLAKQSPFFIYLLYKIKKLKMETQNTDENFGLIPESKKTFDEAISDNSPHVIICGEHNVQTKKALETAIMEAKLEGKKVVLVDDYKPSDNYDLKDISELGIPTTPYPYTLTRLPVITTVDFDTPNKLQFLRNLKLTEEQIEFYKNSPPQRLENESSEDYKTRRMLNKLIVKYRGQF